MKKNLLFAAALLLTLASCSSDNDLSNTSTPLNQQEQVPVSFGTYLGRQASTRSGYQGGMTTELLQSTSTTNSFGVFAYYTKDEDYSTSAKPDFMYNQQITYSGSIWSYTPIKYWPNDFASTAVDNQSPAATGSGGHGRISFFAYAPYVYVTTNSSNGTLGKEASASDTGGYEKNASQKGSTEVGITDISANTATGDPIITYKLNNANPNNNVDLLWGTAGTSKTPTSYYNTAGTQVTGKNTSIVSSTDESTSYYYQVWKDCTKQGSTSNINFNFIHALAKIGNITLAMDPNNGSTSNTGGTGSFGNTATLGYTNVTVQNITIKYTGKDAGNFNLATGAWTPTGSNEEKTITLNSNTLLNSNVFHDNSSEPAAFTSLPTGVTGVKASPSTTDALPSTNPPLLYFLPTSTDFTMTVTITYTLRTYDPNLNQGWSVVPQTISKNITITGGLGINKNYTLNILLGIEDVNFTATVSDWDASSSQEVYLPINVQTPVAPAP